MQNPIVGKSPEMPKPEAINKLRHFNRALDEVLMLDSDEWFESELEKNSECEQVKTEKPAFDARRS